MSKTLVINFFAGPGAGKSTTAAGLFAWLKNENINAEIVTEYAKDKVWEESTKVLENQIYVFGKQLHRIHRLIGKVDVVVTDSPILLSLYYSSGRYTQHFTDLVLHEHNNMNTLNFFIHRTKQYNPKGRMQTEDESRSIDVELQKMLKDHNIPFLDIQANFEKIPVLGNLVLSHLKQNSL